MRGSYFDYHYGNEANVYSFYRIPKTLFSGPIFARISCEAKVLYGLMLDRMSLSLKNNWRDDENRVFICFTLENVCESLCCGHDKGIRLLGELDSVKGIGLIERVKQGLGKLPVLFLLPFGHDFVARAPNALSLYGIIISGDCPIFMVAEIERGIHSLIVFLEIKKNETSKAFCLVQFHSLQFQPIIPVFFRKNAVRRSNLFFTDLNAGFFSIFNGILLKH